jgi:hypothetical protein
LICINNPRDAGRSDNTANFSDPPDPTMVAAMGYTLTELEDAQERWDVRFPPDLVDLLRERRPLIDGEGCIDWVSTDPAIIAQRFAWPFEGFWFDVQHNDIWWPDWGPKPARPADQHDRLEAIIAAAPKLIPLYSHRYMPAEPHERGNPVFSVYQTDIICYGADLHDWLERERGGGTSKPWPAIKPIRFWSDVVAWNSALP